MIAVALLGSTAAVSPTLHCQRSVPVMGVEVSEVRRWPWPRLSDSPSLSSPVWQRSLPWSPRRILSFKTASVLQACSGCFIIRAEVGNPFFFFSRKASFFKTLLKSMWWLLGSNYCSALVGRECENRNTSDIWNEKFLPLQMFKEEALTRNMTLPGTCRWAFSISCSLCSSVAKFCHIL